MFLILLILKSQYFIFFNIFLQFVNFLILTKVLTKDECFENEYLLIDLFSKNNCLSTIEIKYSRQQIIEKLFNTRLITFLQQSLQLLQLKELADHYNIVGTSGKPKKFLSEKISEKIIILCLNDDEAPVTVTKPCNYLII